ncbi:50S ribosomal protein L29 [Mesoplasma lactucae]|uniref:Large ribosomal subunit protein uL29 n=1 Tax=Mesoplasma lactucae ATCC 49193 TaxID=81460 RepID=A0A291IR17_9MOLU|nr:50S ribosomal protein L29 [Mesoplasma lactucae]ATG97178.1 50S ribosomal protein L29 [Mesoplasma lactucae ATCC 49193]ATZ20382.1 50S ribosomal protein L29 [Mesoplasma lactucae ATCC 49193]MCL8216553.1 50S ribosomal protein L29 [Mesoplasma lactucae ATCC 49193]
MPKNNQMTDLRKMSVDDLIKTGEDKRAELFALKFQAVLGSLEQTHRINQIKKEIARIELVLSEKKREGQNVNKSVKADYNKAVEQADADGKKVREKQLKQLQDLQNNLQQPTEEAQADALAKATVTEAKGETK